MYQYRWRKFQTKTHALKLPFVELQFKFASNWPDDADRRQLSTTSAIDIDAF